MSNTIDEWRAATGKRILYRKNIGVSQSPQEAVVAEFTEKNHLKLDHKPQGGDAMWVLSNDLSHLSIIEVLDDAPKPCCNDCYFVFKKKESE